MIGADESCMLHHEHAALLARAQLCRVEAEEAAAAMANIKSLSSSPSRSSDDIESAEISRLHAELAKAASSNANLRTELKILRSQSSVAVDPGLEARVEPSETGLAIVSEAPTNPCRDDASTGASGVRESPDPVTIGSSQACGSSSILSPTAVCSSSAPAPSLPGFLDVQATEGWSARMKDWQSSLERFRRDTQASADIAAYARRLGSAAGVRFDQAREHSLESRLEAQERELLVLQGNEALEQAALRQDEARLACLREELSTAEVSLNNAEGEVAKDAADAMAGGVTGNAGDRLLAQLMKRELAKIDTVRQESDEIRAAIARTEECTNRNKCEALRLGDAREAVLALLEAAPQHLDSRADALRQALIRMQTDIDLIRESGRDISCRSAEVADEFRAIEAELQAERADRELALQRQQAASTAADEQQRVSHLFSMGAFNGKQVTPFSG